MKHFMKSIERENRILFHSCSKESYLQSEYGKITEKDWNGFSCQILLLDGVEIITEIETW